MLRGIAILLLFQLIGEAIAFLAGIHVPGPVIGMVLVFLVFLANGGENQILDGTVRSADALLAHLGMFFVPAGVGIVAVWSALSGSIMAIMAIMAVLAGSALITLLVTVSAFILTRRVAGEGLPRK
ncbi:CidA/LrgA family protein [Agrobacterium sp. LAD9]|uniref:CidA/LrgA family protein n=1 Tax=Agrobacterium sp. LAD9 TaxID=2055153 RepID=UPI000D1F0232|nr:CidA/LrgA family protein [Agrobacterium sp. LAD9]